ncbi:antitoxin VbhA family protein [Mycobacterium hubeiense]|uniref:antitoxin VbhA family protein n=1 Tax=Mycobacterium hubeiense TaxID=1867256 RepID=UPI001E308F29|nr:antitoxin VbhA family protein [Mycobacterium sp. QGD 101]
MSVAVAASGLAGHEVSPGARDLLDRIEGDVLTYDEGVAEVIAEFGQPARCPRRSVGIRAAQGGLS